MMLTLEIAIGVWLGGLFPLGTVIVYGAIADRVTNNRRYGRPWHRGLITR